MTGPRLLLSLVGLILFTGVAASLWATRRRNTDVPDHMPQNAFSTTTQAVAPARDAAD